MDIKEYYELMESNMQLEQIANKCAKWLPSCLYRYRRFGDYWENEVKKGEIYLSEARKLNDPMDCLINLDLTEINENSFFFEYYRKKFKLSYDNYKQIVEQEKEILMNEFEYYRDDIRIACFSENKNSNLMWSHYADMHHGFCIEYNTKYFKDIIKSHLFPILYSKEKPEIAKDFNKNIRSAILKAFVFKDTEWSYEKEWRILEYKDERNKICDKKSIKTIYLGAKCPEDKRNEILEWGKHNEKTVVQMKIEINSYKLSEEVLVK